MKTIKIEVIMSGIGPTKSDVLHHFIDNYFTITCTSCCFPTKQKQASSHVLRSNYSGNILLEPQFISNKNKVIRSKAKAKIQSKPGRMVGKSKGNNDDLTTFRFNLSITIATVIVTVLIHFLTSVFFPQLTPVVTFNDGQVQGKVAYSRGGREYWQFLSIPYAQAPVDKLKFEPPVPVKSWEGVKRTTSWPPFCIQFEAVITQTVFGVEDCLFLNVFAQPFKNGSRNRPVLVHIHGGGFLEGGSRVYGPDYLIDKDLVIVTFNYRLGPYGFLNFEHDSKVDGVDLPRGNMGMKDQLLVLKWVQNNIEYFGGDPGRITIFGDSAGSVSVQLHVLSPQSKGLFHRAISQSGSAFSSWGFTTQPKQVAHNFANKLKCSTENTTELLNCLQNYDPREMVKFQLSCTDPTLLKDNLSPSVESVIRMDTFLHENPLDILESGNFSEVPYMLGVNSGDGAMRTGRFEALPHAIPMLQQNWTEMLGNVLLFDKLPYSMADQIRNFYFGNHTKLTNLDTQSFLNTLTLLFSDVYAFEPVQRVALAHAKSGSPTYLYYYDYRPNFFPGVYSVFKGGFTPKDWIPTEIKVGLTMVTDWVSEHVLGGKGAHQYGAVHGEEMFMLWNGEGVTKHMSWWELDFSENFVKMISDFTRGKNNMQFRGTQWPPIRISTRGKDQVLPYMLLDNSKRGKVVSEPFADRMRFWNSVGIQNFN